MNLQSF